MKAGFAKADITPATGSPLFGFIARNGPADRVDLPLEARALYLEQGGKRAIIIGLDVLGLTSADADAIVRDAAATAGMGEDAVVVGCSHTHAGPMTAAMRGCADADDDYLAMLRDRAVAAARDAVADAADAEAAWGAAPLRIAVNRRVPDSQRGVILGVNPDGPAPREVVALQLTTARRRIALFTYAVHPYCFGPDDLAISPDLFGHAPKALGRAGIDAVYLNGCAGDISPLRAFEGVDAARTIGAQLADGVADACDRAAPVHRPALNIASARLTIPNDDLPDVASLAPGAIDGDHTVRDADRADNAIAARLRNAWDAWYDALRGIIDAGGMLPARAGRVTLLRVGDGAMAILPGEVFYETGEAIAAALGAEPACVAAYGHGYIGYLPTPKAHAAGGYEVDEAHRYIGWWRATPRAADMLRDSVTNLKEKLWP